MVGVPGALYSIVEHKANKLEDLKRESFIVLLSLLLVACDTGEQTQYYDNGSLESKVELKNGKRHGWSYYYNPDGSLKHKSSWKDGLQHGLTTFYHPNGQVENKTQWENGNAHGWSEEYYSNGQLKKRAFKRNGQNIGSLTIFSETGKPVETQIYNQQGRVIYVRQYAEEGRGTEMYIPIFKDEKDTVLVGEEFKTIVSFAYPLQGEAKMLVGPMDALNELTDTVAIIKPTKQGEFIYTFKASKAGENVLPIKFIHKTSEEDTVSVHDMTVKHSYFVKAK